MTVDELRALYRRRYAGPDAPVRQVSTELPAVSAKPTRPSIAPSPDVKAAVAMGLTERQAEIYCYIFEYARQNGHQPSLRELQIQFDIASLNGIRCHLLVFAKKGWIAPSVRGSRSLKFKRRPDGKPFSGFVLPED